MPLERAASDVHIIDNYPENDTDRIIMTILLVVFPPLGVMFKSHGFSKHVFFNVLFYILFVIPAYFHAVWFCFVRQRKNAIFTSALQENLKLATISAAINHKDIEVY
ncbi:unnamed protein product [Caenorhabditis bovis]|uniref:YqaE/Pmp3 family membrane protein n=1 Tax=Caenorhabditis bovis TaxID=2654633 RepID=A0A8S1F9Y3_9PELO|nr:unnamed protein product [Caenorhabditis bovis]